MQRGGLDPRQVPLAGYEPRCLKIVKELQAMSCASYVATDACFANVQNYTTLIPFPTSFETVNNRIQGKGSGQVKKYTYLNDFALDIRRICGNFFRFNYFADPITVKNRKDFARILFKFEQSWLDLQAEIDQSQKGMYFTQPLPQLKWCLAAFDETVKVKVGEKHPIDDFIHPISFYFPNPVDLKIYKASVKNPMCFAEILSNMVECVYGALEQVTDDVDAIVSNCSTYWSRGVADKVVGGELIKSALQLQTAFLKSIKASETAHEANPTKANAPSSAISLMQRFVPVSASSQAAVPAPAPAPVAVTAGKAIAAKGKMAGSVTSDSSSAAAPPASASSGSLKLKFTATATASAMSPPEVVSLSAASAAALERKLDKYLRAAFKLCLDGIKEHYLVGTVQGASITVKTARPFLRAVDPLQFPDYATIITEPIDIGKIEKKLSTGDRYSCLTSSNSSADLAVGNIIRDLTLLRDNAHTYNTGKENVEVRIMADCLLNYFKFLLRECLKFIKQQTQLRDYASFVQTVFGGSTPAITKLLGESTAQDVRTYLEASKLTAEKVIRESELPKLLGVASASASTGGSTEASISSSSSSFVIKKTPSTSAPSGTTGAQKTKKIAASPAPKSVDYRDDFSDDGDEYEPISQPVARSSSSAAAAGKPVKRNLSLTSAGYSAASASTDFYEGSMGGAIIAPLEALREKSAWEVAAEEVWKHLRRHTFVDQSRPTVIANFFHPVTIVDPSIAADYLSVIAQPMDLTTLINMLNVGDVRDAQQFLDLAITIFQNAIDYNSRHQADSSYAVYLVQRCELLKKFTYWIALETLPVQDDTSHANPTKLGYLRKSQQLAERKIRDDILANWYISDTGSSPYTECNKLLKDLQRGRNKNESIQISFFQVPVDEHALADYSVYVRNPTDLSTIKYRLDGSLPGTAQVAAAIDKTAKRYSKYGEFVSDLRRVFSNAIKYNSAHLASDTTGITKLVYEAAQFLQEKLEGLLAPFTVHLADRIERARITNAEAHQRQAEQKVKLEKEEAAAREFEQQYLAELKSSDHVFAADYDLEQKSKLTELQLKAHILAQQRAMLNANNAVNTATMEDLGKDMAADDTSQGGQMSPLTAAAGGMLFGSGMQMNGNLLGVPVPPFPGFGVGGKVPGRFANLVTLKMSVREKAWQHWQTAPGVVTHLTHLRNLKASAARSGGAGGGSAVSGSSSAGVSSGVAAGGNGSSNQPKVRREGANIRLTAGSSAGPASSASSATSTATAAVPTSSTSSFATSGVLPGSSALESTANTVAAASEPSALQYTASMEAAANEVVIAPSQELCDAAEVDNPGNEDAANEDGGAMDVDTPDLPSDLAGAPMTAPSIGQTAVVVAGGSISNHSSVVEATSSDAESASASMPQQGESAVGKKTKMQFVLGASKKKKALHAAAVDGGYFLMDTYIAT